MDISELHGQLLQATEQARYSEIARLCREILQQAPDSLVALDMLGFALFFMGEVTQARDICERTLKVDPNHAYAHKGLGICQAKSGQLEQGEQSLRRAIELRPGWFDPWWDLIAVLIGAQQPARALGVISEARTALPAHGVDWDRIEHHARAALGSNA